MVMALEKTYWFPILRALVYFMLNKFSLMPPQMPRTVQFQRLNVKKFPQRKSKTKDV